MWFRQKAVTRARNRCPCCFAIYLRCSICGPLKDIQKRLQTFGVSLRHDAIVHLSRQTVAMKLQVYATIAVCLHCTAPCTTLPMSWKPCWSRTSWSCGIQWSTTCRTCMPKDSGIQSWCGTTQHFMCRSKSWWLRARKCGLVFIRQRWMSELHEDCHLANWKSNRPVPLQCRSQESCTGTWTVVSGPQLWKMSLSTRNRASWLFYCFKCHKWSPILVQALIWVSSISELGLPEWERTWFWNRSWFSGFFVRWICESTVRKR